MAAANVDAQVQSLIQSLQQPLASRIQALESQARSYERMLRMERQRSRALRNKLRRVTCPVHRCKKACAGGESEASDTIAAHMAVMVLLVFSHPSLQPDVSLGREMSASEDKAFVLTAHREADVGSTAAAAVASALSQAWHRNAEKPGGDDESSSDGGSSSIQPYLSPRQAFQIMVRLGAKKSVHTLSDPSVRHHVRRLTAAQGPSQEAERNGVTKPVHPASLSTGQNVKALGTSPHAASHLLPSPVSTASADTSTILAAFHSSGNPVDPVNSTGCSGDSEPPSARATLDRESLSDHDEIDAVLMAHTSSHIRLRWLADRPPNNVMIVCKPTASVMDAFASTVIKALELHMTIILEPKLFALMLKQLRRALEDCSTLGDADETWEHLHALDPAPLVVTDCTEPDAAAEGGAAAARSKPSLQRHSAGARLISSRAMGGSMPVKLSQLEAAQEVESDPSSMITSRGRLGVKLTATEEALDMAEALRDAFARQMHSLQGALEGVLIAGGDLPMSTADLVAVQQQGDLTTCLAGRAATWRPQRGADCSECPPAVATAVDFVATLGGDGTLLWACKAMGSEPVPPIVPFAMGSLGFMTPFSSQSLPQVMDAVVAGDVRILLRHRLECTVLRHGAGRGARSGPSALAPGPETHLVLNDVSIHRGSLPYLTNLEVYCDDTFVTNVQGDGLLLATPTGSTAYSLAAGGSMVHPSCESIIFTPICPHSLSFRPLIFPDHVQLRVQVPLGVRTTELRCSFDGSHHIVLCPGDALVVQLSKHPVPTVCDVGVSHDWFRSVRDGLYWNLRAMQGGTEADKAAAA